MSFKALPYASKSLGAKCTFCDNLLSQSFILNWAVVQVNDLEVPLHDYTNLFVG